MARAVRSGNKDAHERAEMRLLRKMESLHGGKSMAHAPKHHAGKHKNHESKAEHAKAGRKGGHAEGHKEHVKAGHAAHGGHGAEHKMAEVHVHHHHHHHSGAHAGKK